MLVIVAGIANYFGKSNYGTFHLDVQRKTEGIREGIKSTSETRFSSSYLQVVSVHECMSSIKKCVASKTLKFDTSAVRNLLLFFQTWIWLNCCWTRRKNYFHIYGMGLSITHLWLKWAASFSYYHLGPMPSLHLKGRTPHVLMFSTSGSALHIT